MVKRCFQCSLWITALLCVLVTMPIEARDRLVVLVEASDTLAEFHTKMGNRFSQVRDVEVEVIRATGNYAEQVRVMIASGAKLDVTQLWAEVAAPLFQTGALTDLRPLLARSEGLSLNDFAPGRVQAFTWHDRVYGIPINANVFLGFYNRDAVHEAGLALPESLGKGWDWDALLKYARRLTRDTDADGVTDVYGLTTRFRIDRAPAVFTSQAGGGVFDRWNDPTQGRLSQEESLRALEYLARLFAQERVAKEGATFRAGKSAMWLLEGPFGVVDNANANLPFDWGVLDVPHGPAHDGTVVLGIGYQIPATSSQQQLAWEFIKSVAGSRDAMRSMIEITGRAPAYIPALRTYREYLLNFGDPTAVLYADKIAHPSNIPGTITPKMNVVQPIVENTLRKMAAGEISPQVAALQIDRQVTAVFGE
jgi:ABC-type glycerol-3-phosphate transport system substrate-binding protein